MNQRGFTLIESLLGIAIVVTVVVAIATFAQQTFSTIAKQTQTSESDEIRLALIEQVACDATLTPPDGTPGACASLGDANLRDRAGNIVVKTPAQAFPQGYEVRAKCVLKSGNKEILVEHRKGSGPWQELFEPGISLCPEKAPPRWVHRYSDLKMDPIQLVLATIWIIENLSYGTSSVPVLVGGDSYPPTWWVETTALFYGMARCPRGYTAVTGSVDCGANATGSESIDPAPATSKTFVRRAGYKLYNSSAHDLTWIDQFKADSPDKGFKGVDYWHGACGMAFENLLLGSLMGGVTNNRVEVGCYRNSDF